MPLNNSIIERDRLKHMKTKSNYEVNQITVTIEEAYQEALQTLISNHRNLSAKTISTYTRQFDTLIKFMDIYLDREYTEILTLPITAIDGMLISEYRNYLQYELCLSDNAVNTTLKHIRTFIHWNSKQDYTGGIKE